MVRRPQIAVSLLGLLLICANSCSSPAGPPLSASASPSPAENKQTASEPSTRNQPVLSEASAQPQALPTTASHRLPSTPASAATTLAAATTPSAQNDPSGTEASASRPEISALDALLSQTPRCAEGPLDCFGIHLHIVADERGELVRDLAWVSEQLAGAQDRFTHSVDATFEIVAVDALTWDQRDIVSRSDRDRLGRPYFSRGLVHVFVVGSLANVDDPGEIRGVHWRDRSNTARRWIILSSIAGPMTLTHELGHFFSLPHSRYENSLMNKRPGGLPFGERGFHTREAKRMRRAKKTMLMNGSLKAQQQQKKTTPSDPSTTTKKNGDGGRRG